MPRKSRLPASLRERLVDVDHPRQHHPHPAERDGVEERLVIKTVGAAGDERIDRVGRIRVEDAQVLGDPHPGGVPVAVGVDPVALSQRARHEAVRPHERRQHQRRTPRVAHARRPLRRQIALGHQHVRLVDRAPPVDELAERRARPTGERRQGRRRPLPLPAAARRHPGRQREVIERDHRGDVSRAERREHLPVVSRGGLVPHPLGRLEAAPLDPHPVDVGPQQLERGQIGAPEIPRISGAAGVRSIGHMRRPVGIAPLFPGGPVVVVATFDLIGGGRGPQQEAGRRAGQHLVRGDRGGIEGDRFGAPAARQEESDGQHRSERRTQRRATAQRATASQI